jgi:hypothetical protein
MKNSMILTMGICKFCKQPTLREYSKNPEEVVCVDCALKLKVHGD